MNFKFTINAKTFGDALASLSRVISNKNSIQIMDFIKVVLLPPHDDGTTELILTAMSPENAVKMSLTPTAADGTGEILINAKKLTDLIRKLSDDVTLTIDDMTIQVRTGSGKYELQGVDTIEFPVSEDLADVALDADFDTEEFIKGLNAILYATSTDDYRPAMTGVYIDLSDPYHTTFAATDTRKLAKFTYAHPVMEKRFDPDFKGVVLSAKAANLVRALFGKESVISAKISARKIMFDNNSVKLVATLIQGNFPDYNRVIPRESPVHVGIDRVEMLKALNRVSTFADNSGLAVLRFDNGHVDIDARDYNLQQTATERVSCDSATQMTIGFSISGLTEVLSNMEGDRIDMAMTDPSRPAVFAPAEDANTLALLMPMQLA